MRSAIGGCVENQLAMVPAESGLTMNGHHEGVAILHVGELMRQDALELLLIQELQQGRRHGYRRMRGAAARCERVRGRGGNPIQHRHGYLGA